MLGCLAYCLEREGGIREVASLRFAPCRPFAARSARARPSGEVTEPVATTVYTERLTVRATPEEAARVRADAAAAGLTVSRYLVRQATGRESVLIGAEVRDELAALRRALSRVGSNLNQLARAANSGAYDAAEVEAAAREVRGLGRRVLHRLD